MAGHSGGLCISAPIICITACAYLLRLVGLLHSCSTLYNALSAYPVLQRSFSLPCALFLRQATSTVCAYMCAGVCSSVVSWLCFGLCFCCFCLLKSLLVAFAQCDGSVCSSRQSFLCQKNSCRYPVVCEAVLCHAGTVNDAELAAPAAMEVAKNPGPRIVYPSVSALPRIYRSIANPPSSSFPHQPRAPLSGI